uniref:Uncharacterized protein n=1 Tax=Entomoneis paludosa TaxID=265537 RepID=A0A7S2V838_9STRA|mmetsp:Transcript_11213/g.22937  ORF Transcript_11213/g.22937 Transcript_11213/m.22937 type:complete len:296 (+) Transcript_11213:347-1234(+)|eukprot:CAMPEP_0172461398 /NCGR_PEP_ID=MMETSP1065-20121228/40316_1 /TAXON_ID=265537 /ORGANISM="Amphiprora paludosa, Strain CCMP125" /LENGTH=295 /DNA_ID=CAMNT_0013216689 /DNA_START=291 /DNA_END=1178 /DNA_ORIENTATION=-
MLFCINITWCHHFETILSGNRKGPSPLDEFDISRPVKPRAAATRTVLHDTTKGLGDLEESKEHGDDADKDCLLRFPLKSSISSVKTSSTSSKSLSNGYLTIVTTRKPAKCGYQNTKKYKPSSSYRRARLYPIQEVDEDNLEDQQTELTNPYIKNPQLLPKPVLCRKTNRNVQDHRTPAWQDFPKHTMPAVGLREGYPMKLEGGYHHPAYHQNYHHPYHHPSMMPPPYPAYPDPAMMMMIPMPPPHFAFPLMVGEPAQQPRGPPRISSSCSNRNIIHHNFPIRVDQAQLCPWSSTK